jgi:predicted ferric reductase
MGQRRLLVLLMLLVLVIPVAVWWLGLGGGLGRGVFLVFNLSRLAALMGLVIFGVVCVLGARLRGLESRFGHDRLVRVHWKLSLVALLLALFHSGLLLAMGAGGVSLAFLLGLGATLLLLLMGLAVLIYKVVRVRYEFWRSIHRVNYLVFPLVYVHCLLVGSDLRSSLVLQVLWVVLGFVFIGVLGYKIRNYVEVDRDRYQVVRVVRETDDIWTVELRGRRVVFDPGQFLYLRLVVDGRLSAAHPFSIASSPGAEGLAVSIKASGDFTREVGRVKVGDSALVDAAYGRFSFWEFPGERFVFIAGGIGVTPFMSMLRYMREKGMSKQVVLLWGNKTERDIAFREELAWMEREMGGLKVVHVLSGAPGWGGETGFIDAAKIRKYAGDLRDKEVFVCGPPVMMKMVMRELKSFRVRKGQIHSERFAL